MKHTKARSDNLFKPLIASRSVQAALMTLHPGQSSSDRSENEHPKSEQWLYVISGTAAAKVGKRSLQIKTGSLLLIEKGEPHKITNTGKRRLRTLNFYAPPAYNKQGEVKSSVKS